MGNAPEVLKIVADNPLLIEALKELLKAEFDTPFSEIDKLADEELGQRVRARITGKKAIESAFQKLARYRSGSGKSQPEHPGRA